MWRWGCSDFDGYTLPYKTKPGLRLEGLGWDELLGCLDVDVLSHFWFFFTKKIVGKKNTVDGSEIRRSPVDMVNIPFFPRAFYMPVGAGFLPYLPETKRIWSDPMIASFSCFWWWSNSIFWGFQDDGRYNMIQQSFPQKTWNPKMEVW